MHIVYFVPSSEFNAYLKQIKVILSNFFFISDEYDLYFSLPQIEAISTIKGLL